MKNYRIYVERSVTDYAFVELADSNDEEAVAKAEEAAERFDESQWTPEHVSYSPQITSL